MGKAKTSIIIISCVSIMILLTGYLVFRKDSTDNDYPIHTDRGKAAASTVSPGAIIKPIDSSGNYTYIPPSYEYDDNNNYNKEEEDMPNNIPTKAPWTPATEMDLNPKSITVYINKEHCLPKYYVPENLVVPNIAFDITGNAERKYMRIEAAEAIEKMFAAALEDGLTLYGVSGYRSYSRQREIFLNNIVHKGKKHTLQYSAAPGTSEHQTGLAMDVSSKSIRYKLLPSFAKCDEGKWLANHAHEYGFIIRYPMDQYDITGYAYEPWHIRYVGEDLADYLYTNDMTLDEYYEYEPSEGFDYEKTYADLINYRPPITPTPIPEEELEEEDITDELTDGDLNDDEGIDGDKLDEDPNTEDIDDEDPKTEDIDGENSETDDIDGEDSETDDIDGEDSADKNIDGEDSETDVLDDDKKDMDLEDGKDANLDNTEPVPNGSNRLDNYSIAPDDSIPPTQNNPPTSNPSSGQP